MHIHPNRRRLITGIAALIAAPAVVRASVLMPVSGDVYRVWEWRCPILPDIGQRWEEAHANGIKFKDWSTQFLSPNGNVYQGIWTFFGKDQNIYSDEEIGFRKIELIR